MAIAVIVDERATGIPSYLGPGLYKSGLLRHIGKLAITKTPVQRILSIVSNEQIVTTIVIKVPNAAGLSPSRLMFKPRTNRYIGKRTVPIILEEMTVRLLPSRKAIQPPAIDKEEVDPSIVVIVVKRQSAACRLEQVLVLEFTAIDSLYVQAGFFLNIDEVDTERGTFDRRSGSGRGRSGLRVIVPFSRADLLWCGDRRLLRERYYV